MLDAITPELAEFLEAQHVFFVATAPSGPDGHVNLSPKGLDTFAVLDEHTVAWLDLTGSGIETVAHLRDNGRITRDVLRVRGQAQHRPALRPGRVDPGRRSRRGADCWRGSRRTPGAVGDPGRGRARLDVVWLRACRS